MRYDIQVDTKKGICKIEVPISELGELLDRLNKKEEVTEIETIASIQDVKQELLKEFQVLDFLKPSLLSTILKIVKNRGKGSDYVIEYSGMMVNIRIRKRGSSDVLYVYKPCEYRKAIDKILELVS